MQTTPSGGLGLLSGASLTLSIGQAGLGVTQVVDGVTEMINDKPNTNTKKVQDSNSLVSLYMNATDTPGGEAVDILMALNPSNITNLSKSINKAETMTQEAVAVTKAVESGEATFDLMNYIDNLMNEQ